MKEALEIGKCYTIHGYKHNGKIYKSWNKAILLEYGDGVYVFGNDHTKVTEADGRTWYTKEPAILFFFDEAWFNIIGQCKKRGIFYYCNLASPIVIEEDTIKFIDYDLDVKVFPGGSFKVIDRSEYNYNKHRMEYPPAIDEILKAELNRLISLVRSKEKYFNPLLIEKYEKMYEEMVLKK